MTEATPPVDIHIHHDAPLNQKQFAQLVAAITKEKPVTAPPKAAPAKPGYKTTELLVAVATAVGAIAASLEGSLPPRYAAIAASVASVAYILSRGLAKQ